MISISKWLVVVFLTAATAVPAVAQDKVTYLDRGGKGVQTTTGAISGESLAGIKIGGRTIPSGDVIDVQYDTPGSVRLDYNSATAAEARNPADAVKGYEALIKAGPVQNLKPLKRHLEYKVAALTAARAEDGREQLSTGIAALAKFKKDHPDGWQLVPLARTLGRLLLDKEPPDADGARQVYDDLAQNPAAPADVKQEFTFLAIDLLLNAGKVAEARAKLAALPAADPRVQVYRIACQATPDKLAAAADQLRAVIDRTTDPALKATAYNVLGDCLRRDPKQKKEALYAYLWVDVVYNQDAAEVAKASGRLADLFGELKDEERARKYRDKARGR
jgi:hypothetical protein